MNICLVCLRTDRQTKVNTGLSEFHHELCGFTLLIVDSFYCNECEYLLTKFYKFKQKCMKASEVYKNWMCGDIKVSICTLHKLLPPSSLGLWKPNPKTIGNITFQARDVQPKCIEEVSVNPIQELINNAFIHEIKIEHDSKYDSEVINSSDDEHVNSYRISESDCVEDEKKYDNRTEESLTGKIEILKELECGDNLDFDVIDKTITEINKEPKANKKRKVTNNKKEPNASKKIKVTISKKINSKKKVLTFDRSEEELILKLSVFGDLADVGISIDKCLITKLMQNDAGAPILRNLWTATCREDVLNLLPVIQETLTSRNNEKSKKEVDYSSVFDIEYLTTPEMKLEEFERRKTYECYLKAEHKCHICYQVFKGPMRLESHMNTYHNEIVGGSSCPVCKMWFVTKSRKLRYHRATHLAVYKCRLCPLVTYNRNTLKEHTEKHKGMTYQCKACNVSYKCMSAYYSHVSVYHRRGRVVCARCGRGFASRRSLQVHASLAHPNDPPNAVGAGVRCEECDVTLASQSVYEAHILDVHDPPPDIQTKTRGGHRVRQKLRKEVQPVYRSPRKQKCRVCNVSRAGSGWLKAHFRREHPELNVDVVYADTRNHLCDICGIGWSSINLLREHMLIHTGSMPYSCELCPKKFRIAVHLRNHRLHHLPPTLPCTSCGKKFKTKSNLYNHMKGHTGERNYKCHICDKSFLHSTALNEHVRGVHHYIRRVRRGGEREEGAGAGADGKPPTERKRVTEKTKRGKRIASESDNLSSEIE